MVNELAACSSRPTKPFSVKYFPVQIPSSSGDTTSSDTALSSRMFGVIFYKQSCITCICICICVYVYVLGMYCKMFGVIFYKQSCITCICICICVYVYVLGMYCKMFGVIFYKQSCITCICTGYVLQDVLNNQMYS